MRTVHPFSTSSNNHAQMPPPVAPDNSELTSKNLGENMTSTAISPTSLLRVNDLVNPTNISNTIHNHAQILHPAQPLQHIAQNTSTQPMQQQSTPSKSAETNASILSLLEQSKKVASSSIQTGQRWDASLIPQPPHQEVASASTNQSLVSASKRKLDDPDAEDPHSKIRRIVKDHVSQDPSRVLPMTTVICLHAAVAQKSYGSEKRFLCPPPVVHIEGPVWHMRSQQLSMAVVSETGERSFEQKAPLDNAMTANFKFLHVTSTAKAKSFQLALDIVEPPQQTLAPEGGVEALPGRTWASFESAPVTIISKPSKKTAKTRNISSCILAGGPVSLFNRINSQTVRTKYMTIDHAQLCASNVAWSAFNVNVVRRPTETQPIGGPQPVTYGCEIVLSDTHSGISTSPLVIRKVDKSRVSADDGGPVSQMQKIVLQRVNQDGSRHYLSAAGPIPGTPGVVAPPAPGMSSQAGTHPLLFQSPRIRDEVKDGVRVISDEVDDYLCWTIVGISKFQYTFFDAFGQNNALPEVPITPFPTLFTAPVYRPANNTVELTVSHFFYDNPKTRSQMPLDVYLGNLGPLRHRVYQATPPGPLTNVTPFVNTIPGVQHTDSNGEGGSSAVASSSSGKYIPSGPTHTIVIVEIPPLQDVIKALEENTAPTSESNGSVPAQSDDAAGSSGPRPANGAPPPPSIAGRTLPLLFIRSYDGVGYHSGRTIACENVFQSMDLINGGGNTETNNWLAAAQVAAAADGGLHGWTLRVM